MKLSSLIFFLTIISFVTAEPKITTPVNSINRPIIHLTPPYGWMNDPNGLWYDQKDNVWHVYYQFNPNATHWALPLYWGHATSTDALNWEHTGVAVAPYDKASGAYSGSCVIDSENTSGFFSASDLKPEKRVIAIWTFNHNVTWLESQYISYSINEGVTFKDYRMNPVVSMNSTQFRDPQVIRYENGDDKWWVMSVAKSHQYRIQFYKSNNLKNWKRTSYFELYGLLGYQYECPNLAKIRYEGETGDWKTQADNNGGYLWVLFISINPGSLQGGSSTEYFIGTFNGLKFTPIKNYAAPIDYGKDFYALQVFFNSPKDDNKEQVHAIAWTSNWQYCATVPTDNWRSSMSLVRKLQLADFESAPGTKIPFIKSTPLLNDKLRYGSEGSFDSDDPNIKFDYFHPKHTIDISQQLNGAIEFNLEWKVKDKQWTKSNPANFYLDFRGYAIPDEYLRLGYQAEAGAFFIDRGNTNVEWVHTNRFFTDKISVNVQPSEGKYKVHGIIDRNIVELYFGDGFQVLTNTFFMTGGNFIGSIDISIDSIAFDYTDNKYMTPFIINLEAKQILDANKS